MTKNIEKTNEVKTEAELFAEVSASNGAATRLMMEPGYFSDEELDEDVREAVAGSQSVAD